MLAPFLGLLQRQALAARRGGRGGADLHSCCGALTPERIRAPVLAETTSASDCASAQTSRVRSVRDMAF